MSNMSENAYDMLTDKNRILLDNYIIVLTTGLFDTFCATYNGKWNVWVFSYQKFHYMLQEVS